MTRDELVKRCRNLMWELPVDEDDAKLAADRLADLLLELTGQQQAVPTPAVKTMARGQEVAADIPVNKKVRARIAALIDAERADAARAERERCAKVCDRDAVE